MKVVTQVTLSGNGPVRKSTVTSYYRGSMVRTDSDRGTQIFDTAKGTLTLLMPKQKSYRQIPLSQLFGQSKPAQDMSVKGKITPTTKRKQILGRTARLYSGKATVDSPRGEMSMTLDLWSSASVKVPGGKLPLFANLPGSPVFAGSGAFGKEMSKIEGLPLEGTISIKTPQGRKGAPPLVATSSTRVLSISNEPVDPNLFRVPQGYQKLELKRGPLEPKKLDSHGH